MTSLKPTQCGLRLNGKRTDVNAGPVVSQENFVYCISR